MEDDLNKSPEQIVDPNKSNPVEPNLPGVEPVKEPPQEPADPEFEKWAKDTPDLKIAYKRYMDSTKGAEMLKTDKEKVEAEAKAANEFKDKITQELQFAISKDPELGERLQKALMGETPDNSQKPAMAELKPEDRALLQGIKARESAAAQHEISSFQKSYGAYIKSDSEWENVKSLAASFDGKVDRKGNPYTLTTALEAAVMAQYPEVISDKALMKQMASIKQRDSAAEPGDTAGSGSSGSSEELTDEERTYIERFKPYGVTEESYLKSKAQNL